jgi:hypothetical protein
MPIHDWTRVDPGLFHDFHQSWTVALRDALNAGVLPRDYFALVEQRVGGPIPDVLTLSLTAAGPESSGDANTHAVATAPPRMAAARGSPAHIYARRANRIIVRHRHGRVVAMIEVVSPGNKASRAEFRAFVEKTTELLQLGVHVLIVDLFPPGPRDPNGIHKALWEEFDGEEVQPCPGKPLTLASYDAASLVAYVEGVAVGDGLPEMPLFLQAEQYVPAPLEATYMASWNVFPGALKGLLES